MGAFIRYRREMQSSAVSIAGVEFAGTLRDFVRGDLARKYPELMADVKVPQLKLNLWYLQMPLRPGFADLSHEITCLDSITQEPNAKHSRIACCNPEHVWQYHGHMWLRTPW